MSEPNVIHEDPAEQAGYILLPNAVLLNTDLSLSARLLYGILKHFAWQGSDCFPGQRKLAEILHVTDRSIRTYIGELVEAGLLRSERRGIGKSNLYTLVFPTEWKPASAQSGSQVPTNSTQVNITREVGSTSPYAHLDREREQRRNEPDVTAEDLQAGRAALDSFRSGEQQ